MDTLIVYTVRDILIVLTVRDILIVLTVRDILIVLTVRDILIVLTAFHELYEGSDLPDPWTMTSWYSTFYYDRFPI